MEERLYKVGELARLSGVTVRTLHHYEEMGLLSARARTDSDYRVYGDAEVRKLYQVIALRQLGLKLGQIKQLVEGDVDPMHVVKRHLEAVERALELQGPCAVAPAGPESALGTR